jgi:glycosyltransferase involved in cell wall biosynthesis
MRQNCDLWIFPSQEGIWSYQVPVVAVCTIFDLMHRYEKRFPEVYAQGIYEHREMHYKQMCKWAKGILVDSELGKQQVVESYGTDPIKIHVLPFVPPKYIYGKSTNQFDNRYRLPKKFIFYPAQFWEHKNHKGLVQAVHILREKHPDLTLIFVGSKKNGYKSTHDMVQKLNVAGNIIFLGYVPDEDMPELYRRARGMIMPTFFGPTNIPPLEANVLGCPIAVSNIYAMPEQLEGAALYFDPTSIEEIAHAIEQIWTDDELCQKLREQGFQQANKWNQAHFNKRLYTIIKNILQ